MALLPSTDLSRFKESAQRFASGFTRGQKAVTIVAAIGVLIIGVVFMSFSGKPTYSILFTNLQPASAASITQTLATDHVPYQLQNGGTTILVPQNDVDQERLAAAQAGLPTSSSSGLSILDKEGLTTSQLTQQADYLQAIQDELEQTIDSINGVTNSVVNVAMPANQTFALGASNPTGASVLVDLTPGTTLTSNQVQAITSLVASSVPGLSTSDVTLADSAGNLLAGPGVSASSGNSSAEAAYDTSAEAKVNAYLDGVLGPNNADVQVNALLNFNQVKTNIDGLVTGKNGSPQTVCMDTNTTTTKYTGTGTPPGSTLSSSASTSGSGNYTETQKQQTCDASTESQTVVQAPGSVISQSVAVLVNKKAVPKGLSAAQLQKGVSAAVGLNTKRGDVLSFSVAPFSPSANPATAASPKASMITNMMKPALAALLVILVLVMLWRTSRKVRKASSALETVYAPPLDFEALGMGDGGVLGDVPALAPGISQLSNIQDMVDSQPEEVATVLRGWLQRSQ